MILLGIDPSVIYHSAEPEPVYNRTDPLAKIGEYPYPTNPLNDSDPKQWRATGRSITIVLRNNCAHLEVC